LPEIADEIPGLETKLRGGLADQLKHRIDQARRKALGEARLVSVNFGQASPCDTGWFSIPQR
jgi:hypothetical protein